MAPKVKQKLKLNKQTFYLKSLVTTSKIVHFIVNIWKMLANYSDFLDKITLNHA